MAAESGMRTGGTWSGFAKAADQKQQSKRLSGAPY
jgi:hypothetical protein